MTAAVLLAWLVLGAVAYGLLENLIDPDAIRITVNNSLAGFIRLALAVATIIVALVVLI